MGWGTWKGGGGRRERGNGEPRGRWMGQRERHEEGGRNNQRETIYRDIYIYMYAYVYTYRWI